ncbi:cell division cycle-associated protein 2 isoform X1 [Macrotis lagotis]|uniref:cell division cycle-associated protein 2 isoform X1 n=1 Tax=Macrotis lagotis TaxID=92651 RepID=UPI003D6985F0
MDVIAEVTDGLEIKEPVISSIENGSLEDEKHLIHQNQEAAMDSTFKTPDKPKTPMNFSTITVEQLGITPDSFVKNSPGKSLLKKARRRSTIGVRGSPETNLLIRYIAQQRNLKNANESPLVESSIQQSSPFRYRNGDSLRERISAFRSAFHQVKENEGKPEGESQAAHCTKNKSPKHCDQPKLCGDLTSKRRRISYQRDLKENIADGEKTLTDIQICHITTFPDTNQTFTSETCTTDHSKESSFDLSVVAESGCSVLEDTPLKNLSGATRGKDGTGCAEEETASNAASRYCGRRGKFEKELSTETFETMPLTASVYKGELSSSDSSYLRSVLKKTPVKLLLESLQEHCDTTGYDGNRSFSFSDLKKGCEELKNEKCSSKIHKAQHQKRVTFGEELSPEVFDESLPANTPLCKGGTPARHKNVNYIYHPSIKRLPISETIAQPSFEEPEQELVNMEPLDVSFAVPRPATDSSSSFEDIGAVNSTNKCEKISSPKVDRITRSISNRKQLVSVAEEADFSDLVRIDVKNVKERKPNRKKTQGPKKANRTASKKIQILKNCRRKKGRGKSLQKTFYGLREVASKKPLLSPIPEIPESPSTTASIAKNRSIFWCSDSLDFPKEDYNNSSDRNEDAMNSDTNKLGGIHSNKYLPQNPETSALTYKENDTSELCSSDMEGDSSLGPLSFDQGSNVSTIAVCESGHIQHADKLEHPDHSKKRTKTQNICLLSPLLTLKTEEGMAPIVPNSSLFLLQPLHSAAIIPNVESVGESEVFAITQQVVEFSRSSEKPNDALVASEENPSSAPQAGLNHIEDASLNENAEQSLIHGQDLRQGKPKATGGILTYKNLIKKRRRSSVYCPADERSHFEEPQNHLPVSCSVEELPFDNSELVSNLTESIKQAFRRLNTSGVRVRRSTRFRRNGQNQGLVWVSLPSPPSTSCTSQKAKRRTVCSSNTREFVSGPCLLSSISGRENSESESVSGASQRARRKSFCASTLSEMRNTSRPRYCRRTSLSQRNEENHPNDFEKMEILEKPNDI